MVKEKKPKATETIFVKIKDESSFLKIGFQDKIIRKNDYTEVSSDIMKTTLADCLEIK